MNVTSYVHVVDDKAPVRESLELLLSASGFSVLPYASARAFLNAADRLEAGCVLMDVQLPDVDGITLRKELSHLGRDLPIVVMTAHPQVPPAVEATKAGAIDFLQNPFDPTELLEIVREVIALPVHVRQTGADVATIAARLATLTPREREVMEGVVAGLPNKTIALELGASLRTVEVHRAHVMEKMNARSLAGLVGMAIELERGDRLQAVG
jgi:two-component system response regulator FixJ